MLKPEILAPAGSPASAVAGVNSGCDAIYMGGGEFNARRYADSPDEDGLREIIRQCHLRGVKVHITINILYKDRELQSVLDFASRLYTMGADAFIIQDLGFFHLIREHFRNIALHASTQMTAHSLPQVNYLRDMGFERVVLSRELPLKEIKEITAGTDAETEVFVHGALCVSYSGRCLMSSMLGGRSGNRGSCAQTCRMEYTLIGEGREIVRGYLLSPKDNCAIDIIPELMEAGITSWKLEGRMKSPEYVSLVTGMYRKYVDSQAKPDSKDIKALTQIFNRGGELGRGYFFTHSGRDMLSASPKSTGTYVGRVISARGKSARVQLCEALHCGDGVEVWTRGEHTGTNISREAKAGDMVELKLSAPAAKGDKVFKSYDKTLADSLKNTYDRYTRRQRVKADLRVALGEPLVVSLCTPEVQVECEGPVAEKPVTKGMAYNDLTSQLSKTGNTPFILDFKSGECEPVYVPLSALKEFKRQVCEELERAIDSYYTRQAPKIVYTPMGIPPVEGTRLCIQVYGDEQLKRAVTIDNVDIYCDMTSYSVSKAGELATIAHERGSRLYLALPVIEDNNLWRKTEEIIKGLEDTPIDGYLLRNLRYVSTKKTLIADYTLNVFNSAALGLLKDSCERVALSPELNARELKPLCGQGTEIVVYGRLPLMTTRQCPVGVHMAGKGTGKYCSLREKHPDCYLRDRKGAEFPVITRCDACVGLILNSAPIYVADRWRELPVSEFARLIFTTEAPGEMVELVEEYKRAIKGEALPKRQGVTGGHFFRGVS